MRGGTGLAREIQLTDWSTAVAVAVADFLSFVVELQIFCQGQIGQKFVGKLAFRTLADFLSWLTAFEFGAESISAMLEKMLVHVTIMTIPHWLRYTRAPTNCFRLLHTSRQGPTRRFEN